MRMNNRNKQTLWYAPYLQTCVSTDSEGFENGTYAIYGEAVKLEANISPARGAVVAQQFGDDDQYDNVIAIEDQDTPIDEHTVLWIGVEPQTGPWTNESEAVMMNQDNVPMYFFPNLAMNADGTLVTPWTHIVRKVARSLPTFGCTLVAVSKVTVS